MTVSYLFPLAKQDEDIAVPAVRAPETSRKIILFLRIDFHRKGDMASLYPFAGYGQQHTGLFSQAASYHLTGFCGKSMLLL